MTDLEELKSARKHIAEIGTKLEQERAKNARMREALKYARRFLRKEDHDTDFIDAALSETGATP